MPMRVVPRLMKDRPLPVVHPTAPRVPYVMRTRKDKLYTVLHPVRPSLAIELAYRKRLYSMIDAMSASVLHWVTSAYEINKPHAVVMAHDSWMPADMLRDALRKLANLWLHNFDEAAEDLATYFATSVEERNTAAMHAALRKGGFAVQFHMTPAQLDIVQATVNQNVALIKSIPQQYLTQVEGMVMRSVQTGRDVGGLAKELERQLGVTRRRAALIARDQNNKATSALNTARYKELGIKQAIWRHSHAGKKPRPTHVAMNNKPYDVSKGMWDKDEGEWIFPGQLINCFPGTSHVQFADGVSKAYRRFYSGDLTELVTNSGKVISATFNHPVLTPNGWVAIGLLNEGDDVVEIADDSFFLTAVKHHVNDAVPVISKIFDTLNEKGFPLSRCVSLGADFHGDGIADGDVDVVLAARPLSFGRKSLLAQSRINPVLAMSNNATFGFRFINTLLHRGLLAAASYVGRFSELFSSSHTFVGHTNESRFAFVSNFTTDPTNVIGDSSSVATGLGGQGKYALPGLMLPTQVKRVISIKKVHFEGPIYNLETKNGWYVTEGIITHNCRCVARPIIHQGHMPT